ncbi:MAG: ankyrin repeat domain-containing protein [Spirochaetota bacterium]
MRGMITFLCLGALCALSLTADVNDDLLSAFDRGDVKAIDEAIARNANPNTRDSDGFSALMYAVAFGKKDYITALIAKGADTSPKANKGMTLAMAYAACGAVPELKAALAQSGVNDVRFDGRTALMYAAMNKELAAMKHLVASGANVHAKDADGWSAVMFLCANDKKASKRVAIGRPRGPMKAAGNPSLAALEFLAASGANLKEKTPERFTTLMYSAINNDIPTAQYLIRKGVEVDALNDDDRSALMYAAMNNNAEMVKMLLAEGADVNVRNTDLWTPLMYACATEKQVTATDAAAKEKAVSSVKNNLETISVILRSGADLQARNKQGGTALLYAAENANAAAVSMIISEASAGAFNALSYIVNTPSLDGMTPLMHAVLNGGRDMALLLLEKDADINAQDLNGMTALMFASRDGDEALVKLLTDELPDLGMTDMNGWGPLYYASLGGHMAVVSILISRNTPVNGRELKAMYAANSPVIDAIRSSTVFRERQQAARSRYAPPEAVVNKYAFGLIEFDEIPSLKSLPKAMFTPPYSDDWLFDTMPLDTVLTLAEIAPAVQRNEGIAVLRVLTNFDGGETLLTNYPSLRDAFMRALDIMLVDRRLRAVKPAASMHERLVPFLRRAPRPLPTKPERQALSIDYAIEKIYLEFGDSMKEADIRKMRETRTVPLMADLCRKKGAMDIAVFVTNEIARNAPRELSQLLMFDAYSFTRDTPWLSTAGTKVLLAVMPIYWNDICSPMTYFDAPAFDQLTRDALRFGDAAEHYPTIRKSRYASADGFERPLAAIARYAADATNRAADIIDALLAFTPRAGMTKQEVKFLAESPIAEGKALSIVNAGKTNEVWKFGKFEVLFSGSTAASVMAR